MFAAEDNFMEGTEDKDIPAILLQRRRDTADMDESNV